MPSLVEVLKMLGVGMVGLTVGIEWICWLHRRLKPTPRVTEVLFFPSKSNCMERLFAVSEDKTEERCPCGMPHGLSQDAFTRLITHLLSARISLDVCVFSFSNFELSRAVLLLHSRGVFVRVITDRDYQAVTGSQIGVLRKAGICVRHEQSRAVHMHHKFAIVDGRLLISGSLNWTLTAVQSNQENLLVTDDPAVVSPYRQQFLLLWESNDPANHKSFIPCRPSTPSHAKGGLRRTGDRPIPSQGRNVEEKLD